MRVVTEYKTIAQPVHKVVITLTPIEAALLRKLIGVTSKTKYRELAEEINIAYPVREATITELINIYNEVPDYQTLLMED